MYVVKITDGLGNQMFQYAFARKLQMVTGKKVYLDSRFVNHENMIGRGKGTHFLTQCATREYGLSHYKITLSLANQKILRRWNYLTEERTNQNILEILAKNNLWYWQYKNESEPNGIGNVEDMKMKCPTYFEGYFFNLEYYEDITGILQKEFSVSSPIKISKEIKNIMKNENTVSLHVRKGDFIKLSRDISQSEYYTKALHWVKDNISNPYYLIFSDDIEWVKQNLKIESPHCYVSGRGLADYEEMCIMKHCKHNIIANSTFSYWAAYLNRNKEKKVIYPSNWRKAIIPNEWLGL